MVDKVEELGNIFYFARIHSSTVLNFHLDSNFTKVSMNMATYIEENISRIKKSSLFGRDLGKR